MKCPKCHADNPDNKKFCSDCGAPLTADADAIPHAAQVREQVQAVLEANYKDQKLVEIDLIEQVTTRLIGWAKLFASFVGIPLSVLAVVLGFLGIKATLDLSSLNDRIVQIKKDGDALTGDLTKLKEQRDRLNQLAADVQTINNKVETIEEKIAPDASLNSTPDGAKILSALKEFQQHFRTIGFVQPKGELKVSIDHHQKDDAYFQWEDNHLIIGDDLAPDLDTAYREYSHHALSTVNQKMYMSSSNSYQIAAIESGLADYFTCSYTGNPHFAEKSAPVFQKLFGKQAVPKPFLRNLDNNRSFSEINPNQPATIEPHNLGELWGGVFWEIRKGIGSTELADKLLFATWTAMQPSGSPDSDAAAFANTLLQEDRTIENGDHAEQIKNVFARHGLNV